MHVKICGVTNMEDAVMCVRAGASAIGLNFVSSSPRLIDEAIAVRIVRALPAELLVVGVVANMPLEAMRALRERVGLGCLQLHGDESADDVAALLPHAYKAVRVTSAEDVARAETFPGEHLLLDGAAPGTGKAFDWFLVGTLGQRRKLTIAGGLNASNVAFAIGATHPYCVDVASGVEVAGNPRRKDVALARAFMIAARAP